MPMAMVGGVSPAMMSPEKAMMWLSSAVIVLLVIEKLPCSYANRTALNSHIIAFSGDIIAGVTPPTIAIGNDGWTLEDCPVPSQLTAASKTNKI